VRHRAALLLTDPCGSNVESLVKAAVRQPSLSKVEAVIYVANLASIPMEQRLNPIPTDKDSVIEMEPLTPPTRSRTRSPSADCSTRPAVVFADAGAGGIVGPRRRNRGALIASDRRQPAHAGDLSRQYGQGDAQRRLRNDGRVRQGSGPRPTAAADAYHDVFLWEGHHNTLIAIGASRLGRAVVAVVGLPAKLPGLEGGEGAAATEPRFRRRGRLLTRMYSASAAPTRWRSRTRCSTNICRWAGRCGRRKTSVGLHAAQGKAAGQGRATQRANLRRRGRSRSGAIRPSRCRTAKRRKRALPHVTHE